MCCFWQVARLDFFICPGLLGEHHEHASRQHLGRLSNAMGETRLCHHRRPKVSNGKYDTGDPCAHSVRRLMSFDALFL